MFLPSPRNTEDNFMTLLEQANTSTLITGDHPSNSIISLIQRRRMRHFTLVGLETVLSDEQLVEPVPFLGTWDEYRMRTSLKLHTSGSTGIPKIIPIKHGLISNSDAYSLLAENDILKRFGNSRVFIPFPPFHIVGVLIGLPTMAWVDSTVIVPPVAPLSAPLVDAVHRLANVQYSMLAPSLIDDLVKNPEYLANLGQLNGLNFSGGPLSEQTAKLVAERTVLHTSLGATEYGGLPLLPKEPEDWAYLRFDEDGAGIQFMQTDQPELYELCFVRDERKTLNQPIFVTFPDLQEYHTRDCFSKHPTRPGLWKYATRLDDLVVFSNGEKINPVMMEGIITANPAVKACLVIGQGRFQSGLIVEPQQNQVSTKGMIDSIWSDVQRANQVIPSYGRINKECIFLTKPGKPFQRAPKGTIQRARSNAVYEAEINELYRNLEIVKEKSDALALDLRTLETSEQSVKAYIVRDLDIEDIGWEDDFFKFGMDSLQLISLVRAMNSAMGQTRIDQKQVYDNSTIRKLAKVLFEGAPDQEEEDYDDFDSDDEDDKATWVTMQEVFKDISTTLPHTSQDTKKPRNVLKSTKPPPLFQPDGGTTAWLQVLASFLINLNNWGLVNSFGVYQAFYSNNYLSTYSASDISWIGTLQGALLLIVGVVSGPLFDKGYCRPMTIAGSIGVVFALMMLSLSTKYYQIILSQGILTGLCLGLLYIPSVALIPLYFKKRRGLALGLATAGGSMGGVIYPIVFRRLLELLGFGWATRVIAFIALFTLSIAILLLRPVGSRTASRELLDLSAFKDLPYATFTAAGFLLFAGVLVPFFLTTTYAATALHTTPDLAFYTLSILNAAQFFGRILPALASDYIGPEILLLGAMLATSAIGFAWIAVSSIGGYMAWLVFFGFASGMVVTLPAAVLPFVSPSLAVIGTRLGMLYALGGVGFLVSTPIASAVTQRTTSPTNALTPRSYLGAQVWIGAVCVAAAAVYSVTCVEAWRRRRLYESRKRKKRNSGGSRGRNLLPLGRGVGGGSVRGRGGRGAMRSAARGSRSGSGGGKGGRGERGVVLSA